MLGDVGQQSRRLLPARHVENPTAYMGLKPYYIEADLACMAHERLQIRDRYAELGMGARGAHMVMMAATRSGVDADEDLAIAEYIRPRRQRIGIIYGDSY